MSAWWDGNLLNRPIDMAIDSIVLILIASAYIPQLLRFRHAGTASGLSTYYVLFNVLFSNAHLSQALLSAAYAWPTGSRPVLQQIGDGSLIGLKALGGVLGLLQISLQWSWSVAALMSLLTVDAPNGGRGAKLASVVAFLHAAAVLFPVAAITLPKPPARGTMDRGVYIGLAMISNRIVAPCCTVLQFFAQFCEARSRNGSPGSLSLLSVGLQVLATATVASRWLVRLGRPVLLHQVPPPDEPAPISLWYEWAFPAANYMMHAMGYVLLLAYYYFAARRSGDQSALRESMPLLG